MSTYIKTRGSEITTKKLVADVPIELHTEIKVACSMMRTTMEQFITKAVRAQLDKDRVDDSREAV